MAAEDTEFGIVILFIMSPLHASQVNDNHLAKLMQQMTIMYDAGR